MNLSGLLSNLTLGTQAYKVDRMSKINGWFPRRKMVCVGDSTQSDPEAYGEMYDIPTPLFFQFPFPVFLFPSHFYICTFN